MSNEQPVLTISASYGAGGSVIAPALAERLHLPFVGQLPDADINREAVYISENAGSIRSPRELTEAEEAATPENRLFTFLAWGASGMGTVTPNPVAIDTDDHRRHWAEAGLDDIRAGGGGVVLGQAAAVILAQRPRTFHVRLDGPPERRNVAAGKLEGIPDVWAAEQRAYTDRARHRWVKRLYRADVTDPKWYHLWIDTTVIAPAATVDLIGFAFAQYLSGATSVD